MAFGPEVTDLFEAVPDAIIVVNLGGQIVAANSYAERLFEYSPGELVGAEIEILVPSEVRRRHTTHRDRYFASPRSRPMGETEELIGLTRTGRKLPVEISLSPFQYGGETLIISAIRDVSERRKAHRELRRSLREKEVLLKEVYHRVKNNLQVISSLINLQIRYITDEHARSMCLEIKARVQSIALVHEKLYQSSDLSELSFQQYALSLFDGLFESYGVDRNQIALRSTIDDLRMDMDTAINCGLVLNELVSNSIKYAFPNGKPGVIAVSLCGSEKEIELTVRDNGCGVPAGFLFPSSGSLGLRLVEMFAKELDGKVSFCCEHGVEVTLTFPRRESK